MNLLGRAEGAERAWMLVTAGLIATMVAVITLTAAVLAIAPPNHVQAIDAARLHLEGEFVQANLGTELRPDGSAVLRMVAAQYRFAPDCWLVPAGVPVTLRATSPDVLHGLIVAGTNVNVEIVPGYVSEVRTTFDQPGDYYVPCHEFCGLGHQAMWARLRVVPRVAWPSGSRVDCEAKP